VSVLRGGVRLAFGAIAVPVAMTVALAVGLSGCTTAVSGSGSPVPPRPGAPATASSPPSSSGSIGPDLSTASPRPPAPAVVRHPVVNHCVHNAGGKLVLVSVRRQHVWMCAGHRTVFATPVTTGAVALAYDATPVGNYEIQGRDRNTTLTLNTGQTYQVKYWIPFSAPLFGFHDASWQHFPFGSPRYRTHGSHGCVHMPLRAMRFLYRWGAIGTPVHIRR
jgi:lipoprotein-anchoring transpeptidase ErfK/SrfK